MTIQGILFFSGLISIVLSLASMDDNTIMKPTRFKVIEWWLVILGFTLIFLSWL